MRTIYDLRTDSLFVRLSPGQIVESEEVSPGVVLDFDAHGRILAFEVLRARTSIGPGFDSKVAVMGGQAEDLVGA